MDDDTYFLKIIVVGDSGVGKTCLLNRYCYEKFDNTTQPTVGCDFCTKVIADYNKKTIRLQLWDVAGQERFKNLLKMYIRGALGCVIVSDISKPETLKAVLEWKKVVAEQADPLMDGGIIPMILMENKSDLLDPNEINNKKELIENFVRSNGFSKGFMTSAKENFNLNEAFQYLTNIIINRHLSKSDSNFQASNFEPNRNVSLKNDANKIDSTLKNSAKCC